MKKERITILALLVSMLLLAFSCGTNGGEETPPGDDVQTQDNNDGPDGAVEDLPPDVCVPQCEGKACGDDGCGGSCGSCPPGCPCVDFQCGCEADCAGKECGPDGIGGFCGNGNAATEGCEEGEVCNNGLCEVPPEGDCTGKQCGPDGAGGSCGTCPCEGCDPAAVDCINGQCEAPPPCSCPCIFDCFETCPQGDQACYQNCVNSADIEGQVAYNALITCLDESGYFECAEGDEECLEETFGMCMDEYYGCFHGDMECVDMYLCIIDCPPGEAGSICAQECFANGTVEALKSWDAFIACLEANGYFDCAEGDDACLEAAWDACSAEFTACAHGELTCNEMFSCLETCAPTDQMCGLSCIVHGTVDAQGQWDAMVDCIVEQCGEQTDPECENTALEGACAGVYNACIGS